VSDRPKLWTLLQDVDVVYHLAARVSVPESVLYPRDYNDVNVGGTVALMEAMRDVGVRRVVLASSGAVYGDLSEQPLREALTPNPRSPYAVSKLAAEYYVRTIGALWGIETVSLRIFNAYGPGQHLPASHPPVVPHYLKQALRGGTLVVHGDGSQTRDYVYVDDVVSALVAAATAPNVDGLVINVGSGTEASLRELIKAVQDVTGTSAEVIFNSKTSGGVSRLCADLTLASQKLNYRPSISLQDGLRLTLKRDPRFK
jgi:UDP-glucose 4-epimerase